MDKLKRLAAEAAIECIEEGSIIGIGTGSTVAFFIQALVKVKHKIDGVVATSQSTQQQLQALHVPILDLNSAGTLPLYVDGADEINAAKQMIKGGGGALTREKIVAINATTFVCIADQSKYVDLLGQFPVAVEVLPMARSYVAREIVKLGGTPNYREGFITDNGNVILDIYNLNLTDLLVMEQKLKAIIGVIESGIFAKRRADVLLLGTDSGVRKL